MTELEKYKLEQKEGKKVVVVYGNCHTSVIRAYLENCKEFCENYVIYPIAYIQDIIDASYFTNEPAFSICDVFIHQSIQKNNRYGEEFSSEYILKILKNDCKIISIPNVYHLPLCFFPEYVEGGEFRDKINTVFFRDRIIDYYYQKGASAKEIYSKYLDSELFAEYNFKGEFEKFIYKIKTREKDWDIKVSDFIIENYKTRQLFYDPNHPTGVFFTYVGSELLKILEINNPTYKNTKIPELDSFEMPIYYSTAKYFLSNIQPKDVIRTYMGRKVLREDITVKKYIKQYLSMEWQNNTLPLFFRMKSLVLYTLYKIVDFIFHVIEFFKNKLKS